MSVNTIEAITYRDIPVPPTIGLVKPIVRTRDGHSLDKGPALVTPKPQESGFWADIKRYFKTILNSIAVVFNVSRHDDKNYSALKNELTAQTQSIESDEGKLKERIESLYIKSLEAVYYGQKQKENGRVPWEGMPENVGVPMSAKQSYLSGGSPRQRYFYNLSLNLQARAWLNGYEIRNNKDIDNSQRGKAWDPEDTARLQSVETTYWLERASNIAPLLRVNERHITARGAFPSPNLIRPIGQNPNILSPAILNGAIEEVGGGRSLLLQELAHGRMSFNTFNSSVIHTCGEPLYVSNKVLKVGTLYNFLSGPNAPRVNGKTFLEAYADLVEKKKCSVFELKSMPKYLLETIRATREIDELGRCTVPGEVYEPHYLRICRYKQEEVDEALQRGGITEKEAWINFAKRVRKDVKGGISHWQLTDKINKEIGLLKLRLREEGFTKSEIDNDPRIVDLTEELKEARKEAIKYIRLPGADKEVRAGYIDFYKLISEEVQLSGSHSFNPQAFYELCKEAELITIVVHNYDPNETPIEEFFNEIQTLYNQYANLPEVRRFIAQMNMTANNENKFHPDIARFVGDGIQQFVHNGTKAYLEWRMLQYLMHHYTKEELQGLTFSTGERIFDCSGSELKFSRGFIEHGNRVCLLNSTSREQEIDVNEYLRFIQTEFGESYLPLANLTKIIETFLPAETEGGYYRRLNLDKLVALANKSRQDAVPYMATYNILSRESCFYPSEMYTVNSTPAYDKDKYSFHSPICLFRKHDVKNKQGQYYGEDGPNVPKSRGLPSFEYLVDKKIVENTVGDSKADIPMHAACLLRGGYVDIVLNLIQKRELYEECIKQRMELAHEFRFNNELYQACRIRFGDEEKVKNGFSALEKIIVEENGKRQEKYAKIIGFTTQIIGSPEKVYEEESPGKIKLYDREDLIKECDELYSEHIIENESPEAYVRRQAEIFGLFTGEDIEYDPVQYKLAKNLYERKERGEKLSDEEQILLVELLLKYQRLIEDEKRGFVLPDEAPSFAVYREWLGKEVGGREYKIYRSKSHNGELVIDRLDGKPPELFKGSEKDLESLTKIDITFDSGGKLICLDQNGEVKGEYSDLESLNDHVLEHRIISRMPQVDGLFTNNFLTKVLGKKGLEKLVKNLPSLFRGLLNYSGILMSIGGLLRLSSGMLGSWQEGVYKLGYRLSNGVRAIAALGGALRGQLNVHKYHNISIGEVVNIIASLTPNGIKHALLGLGNLFLFIGRAQQTVQRTQKTNTHLADILKGKIKIKTEEDLNKAEADPRTPARMITRLVTGIIQQVKSQSDKAGLSSFLSQIVGSMSGAALASIQMLKDIIKDPRLILQIKPRMSEKSGEPFTSVPSPGHLLNLVGVISGIGAVVAGTLGRSEKLGDIDNEDVFNKVGRWAASIATGIPAFGIIANARDVMANQSGIPKLFGALSGSDNSYNSQRAGICQMFAGLGIGLASIGRLSNQYIASLFDIANGLYFVGAGEEEVANSTQLGLSILRRGQKLYKEPLSQRVIDFSST